MTHSDLMKEAMPIIEREVQESLDKFGEIVEIKNCDVEQLQVLISDFLSEEHEAGCSYIPSTSNIETLLRIAIGGSFNGDPCLALMVHRKMVGFIIMTPTNSVLKSNHKLIHALALYIIPEERRKHFARRLRNVADAWAARQGYERVVAVTFSDPALKSAISDGCEVKGTVVYQDLKNRSNREWPG